MPIFNTEEGKKKKTFKELMLEPSGLIQDVKGTRPFRFPNTIGDYISEEEAGRIKEGFKPAETFKDTINYPYGGERTARIAAQYRPQDNIISRIKETPPTVKFPDVWRGSIYTPGTVSTPEEQAFYERQSRQTLGGAITKSEPVYNNEGKIVGREEVPDIGAQHKALYETPEKQERLLEKPPTEIRQAQLLFPNLPLDQAFKKMKDLERKPAVNIGDLGLKESQKATRFDTNVNNFNREDPIQAYQKSQNAHIYLKKALKNMKEGGVVNPAILQNTMLYTINKLDDPTSAVLIQEFFRIKDMQSTPDVAWGFLSKIRSGGAGLSPEMQGEFLKFINERLDDSAAVYNQRVDYYRNRAQKYESDMDMINQAFPRAEEIRGQVKSESNITSSGNRFTKKKVP
jgi:hypothetical protein